ncbi:IclR family transcriptional regulator [Branchiibius sp. NY16-3462-2]|uniref:IclR family transcriptional regulator n=1 Tax=Branchiibius sp. NY16-3462-2 TaxID=1807500 RepID=UPI000799314F|nr:IclR family transcriptional regulator [Branchiibius sp. NY16-3462-2]KYH44218.1 hypothetical protein AZH51_06615 [Branchiibius sp. NY16-3462-2]
MPAPIQSIERAANVLHLLAAATEPVMLGELARMLDLPKPTVHGIVRTLVEVGFVAQEPETGRYLIGADLARLGQTLDPHLLRSRSANWADQLAATTGLEVQLGVLSGNGVLLLHHVFRPDGSPQRLRIDERQPLHATSLGQVLLAFSSAAGRLHTLELHPFTASTITSRTQLARTMSQVRRQGYAVVDGTLTPGVAAVAAPILHYAGVSVGALAVVGRSARMLDSAGRPRERLPERVVDAATAISQTLQERL